MVGGAEGVRGSDWSEGVCRIVDVSLMLICAVFLLCVPIVANELEAIAAVLAVPLGCL